jgi:hypothetical protein
MRQPYLPPSPRQLDFARDLGIDVPTGACQPDVRRLISRKIKQLNRAALRDLNPRLYDLYVHPKFGECEITRVGANTGKVTLLIISTNRKFVVDAYKLTSYKRLD